VLLLCVPLAWHLGRTLHALVLRLTYPMDLDWFEGGMLLHAHRLLHGQPLYGPPESVFLPFTYPPVHYHLLAAVGVVHLDYWTARLLSIAFYAGFCVVTFAAVRAAVRVRTLRSAMGLLAVNVVIAAQAVSGAHVDLVRTDAVMTGLMAASLWIVAPAFPPRASGEDPARLSPGRAVLLAAVLVMTAYTKQTAVFWVAWVLLALVVVDLRRAALVGALCATLAAALLGLLQWASHGWFWKWAVTYIGQHPVEWRRAGEGLLYVWMCCPYLLLLPVLLLVAVLRRQRDAAALLWGGSFLAAVPVALLPYVKLGGWHNDFAPMVMLGGPATILLLVDGLDRCGNPHVRRWGVVACLAAGALWFTGIRGHPGIHVPGPEDRAAARALNEHVAGLPGSVVVPFSPYLPVRYGQDAEQWYAGAYHDAELADLPDRLGHAGAIVATRPDWVLIPSEGDEALLPPGYEEDHLLPPELADLFARCAPVTTDLVARRTGAGPVPPTPTEPATAAPTPGTAPRRDPRPRPAPASP